MRSSCFHFLADWNRAGRSRAQDEIATLPRLLRVRNVDAKIRGNEISHLRQLYHVGRLRPSRRRGRLFPGTSDPVELNRLIQRGGSTMRDSLCVSS
jgi:hypothetical protein